MPSNKKNKITINPEFKEEVKIDEALRSREERMARMVTPAKRKEQERTRKGREILADIQTSQRALKTPKSTSQTPQFDTPAAEVRKLKPGQKTDTLALKAKRAMQETVERYDGTLIEINENEEITYIVETILSELINEGYDEKESQIAIEYALSEANITYGHDTEKPYKKSSGIGSKISAIGRLARKKLSKKVDDVKSASKDAVASGAKYVAKRALDVARKMESDKDSPSSVHSKPGTRSPKVYSGGGVGQKEKVGGKSTSTNSTKSQKTPDPWKDDVKVKSKKTTTTKPKPKKKSSKLDDLISSIRNESKVYEGIVDQPTPADDQVRDKQSDTRKRQQLSNMKRIQQKREQLAKQTLKLQQQDKMPLHSDSYEPEGDLVDEANIQEKSLSKSQQRFMGMVYATKKGEKAPSPEVAKAAEEISKSEAKKFAETKHKDLPEKVKEDAQLGEATAAAKRGLREPHRSETLKDSGKREADELRQTPRGRRELQRRSDYRRQKQTPEAQAAQRARDDESEKVKASNRRPLTTKQRAMSAAIRASGSLGT
jgi:hypothetical protein